MSSAAERFTPHDVGKKKRARQLFLWQKHLVSIGLFQASKLEEPVMANHVLIDTSQSMGLLPNWQPNWQITTKCEIPQKALAEQNLLASFLRSTPHLSEPSFDALYVANNPSYRCSRCDIALANRLLQLLIRNRLARWSGMSSDKNRILLQTQKAIRSRSFYLSSISKDTGLAHAPALDKYVIFCTLIVRPKLKYT